MDDSARTSRSVTRRRYPWCCHIGFTPASPDNLSFSHHHKTVHRGPETASFSSKPHSSGVPDSPQSSRSVLSLPGRIHARRILSPGRVSPIDPDHEIGPISSPAPESAPPVRARSFRAPPPPPPPEAECSGGGERGVFDVRLNLRGKNGSCLALELSSEVLSANSVLFAGSIAEHRKGSGLGSEGSRICRIEVPEVENLAVFKDTIELMFEDDITRRLVKIGVYRSIDILEVSAVIMFNRGVSSCLKYLEAVPWSEDEEEKLRTLFGRIPFDDATGKDIAARLYMPDDAATTSDSQESLARKLVRSITGCVDNNARNELKLLVKGLLCRSSVYEKDQTADDLREGLYATCRSCLDSLVRLFEDDGDESERPLIERVSREVDNVVWMVEILLDWQAAEEFVDVWAGQGELLERREAASPMVRYEVSRVSAVLFVAMGTRKLQCRSESRAGLVRSWFGPMLADFGWLQRRKKGLDTRALEEAMGLTLLTLPPGQQYALFMEWFRCFSRNGSECPNLSKAFQTWWRRSFLRGSEPR